MEVKSVSLLPLFNLLSNENKLSFSSSVSLFYSLNFLFLDFNYAQAEVLIVNFSDVTTETLLKGKGRKRKRSSEGTRRVGSAKKEKNQQKPATAQDASSEHLEVENLQLYIEDFVEEVEELLAHIPPAPKKRCLRSSSTEDKDSAPAASTISPSSASAGPSCPSKLLNTSLSKKYLQGTPSSTNSVKKEEKGSGGKSLPAKKTPKSAGKSPKNDSSSSTKGKYRSRKTGSCASHT